MRKHYKKPLWSGFVKSKAHFEQQLFKANSLTNGSLTVAMSVWHTDNYSQQDAYEVGVIDMAHTDEVMHLLNVCHIMALMGNLLKVTIW